MSTWTLGVRPIKAKAIDPKPNTQKTGFQFSWLSLMIDYCSVKRHSISAESLVNEDGVNSLVIQ